MNIEKIDETVLALLQLTSFTWEGNEVRSWKSHDWDVLSRLHEKGYIHNPVGKQKSVVFTPEGLEKSKELFEKFFCFQ